MSRFFLFLSGFALAACQTVAEPAGTQSQVGELALLPTLAQVERVKLSGAVERLNKSEREAADALDLALADVLRERGVVVDASTIANPIRSGLAELVLPTAARSRELPTAADVGHWRLIPTSTDADMSLIVVHHSRATTSGHKMAEVGLSLAFAAPSLPGSGRSVTYGALVDSGSGEVLKVRFVSSGNARTAAGAHRIAGDLLDQLGIGAP